MDLEAQFTPGFVSNGCHTVIIMRPKFNPLVLASIQVGLPALALLAGIFQVVQGQVRPLDWELLGVFYLITHIGIEGGVHRHFAHKAFQCSRLTRAFFAISGSMAAQGSLLYWATVHRMHHAYSDDPKDPHSPFYVNGQEQGGFRGFLHSHVGWLFAPYNVDDGRFIVDLLKDRTVFWFHCTYWYWVGFGLLVPALIAWAIEPSLQSAAQGLLWGGLIRICLVQNSVWLCNSLCHLNGRSPYKTKGQSYNIFWLSIPSLGMAWHNNHHAFPSTAYNAFHWWQPDVVGYFIFLLAKLGLVWDVSYPSPAVRARRLQEAVVAELGQADS